MTRIEFINELRDIFESKKVANVTSILEEFDEHFHLGYEQGLQDDTIIKALGTPQEIYRSYVEEGIVTDEGDTVFQQIDRKKLQEKFAYYKERIMPQMPAVAKKASKTILFASSLLAYVIGVCIWVVTPAILYLLAISWQPFTAAPPLPEISSVTLGGLFCTGIFSGLTCIFVGKELMEVRHKL